MTRTSEAINAEVSKLLVEELLLERQRRIPSDPNFLNIDIRNPPSLRTYTTPSVRLCLSATMLSLRALTRAAPRTASRIATTSSSIRPAFQNALRSRIAVPTPRIATFSTTRARFDEHSQQLAAKLEQEINLESEESEQQAGSDSNVEQFKAENPFWEIQDTKGDQDVFLTRKFDDETITVHFSIADFNQQMYNEDEMDNAMADEEDMDLQSGGANTKGSINRGGTANDNFKVAPEDSIAPADREELRDEVWPMIS